MSICCPVVLYFPESHWQSEIPSLSKVILALGKARSHRAPNQGCRGAESPGWFDVLPKISTRDVMHEQVHCYNEAANHQLPIAVTFWIIWILSTEECWRLMQNVMLIHCTTYSVILNVMATQYTCSLNGIYCPHWLVQSLLSLFTHVHAGLLSLAARLHQCPANRSHCIDNGWIISGQTSSCARATQI